MPWNTPEDIKAALADTWMLDYMKEQQVPATLADLWVDEGWFSIFYQYAQSEYSTENIDFLRSVESFEGSGDLGLGKQIYDEFVSTAAARQVNLPTATRVELDAIFGEGGTEFGPPSLFDGAKDVIWKMLQADTFNQRFRGKAVATQEALWADHDWDAAETRERA